jgi:hypothetical protein
MRQGDLVIRYGRRYVNGKTLTSVSTYSFLLKFTPKRIKWLFFWPTLKGLYEIRWDPVDTEVLSNEDTKIVHPDKSYKMIIKILWKTL